MKFSELVNKSGLVDLDYNEACSKVHIKAISDDSRGIDNTTIFCINSHSIHWIKSWQPAHYALILAENTETIKSWIQKHAGIRIVYCKDINYVQGMLASALYNHPTRSLNLYAVTGTNGKTSITQMMYHVWKKLGKYAGCIGTLGVEWIGNDGEKKIQTGYTTPRSPQLQKVLAQMFTDGVKDVAIEVSSEALDLGRLAGCHFHCSMFTNLTQDHLDHHGNMESYYLAKKNLFEMTAKSNGQIIINVLDKWGQRLVKELKQEYKQISILSFSKIEKLKLSIPVEFNYVNANLVLLALEKVAHQNRQKIINALENMPGVPGRFELIFPSKNSGSNINNSKTFAIVDYAHTPDALKNLLISVKKLNPEYLICIFGCGGDRDATKRPIMGNIASDYSDLVIVCDDNPRSESPQKIRSQIISGITKNSETSNTNNMLANNSTKRKSITNNILAINKATSSATEKEILEIGDRKEAINCAVLKGKELRLKTIIVVAGKGHEEFQIQGSNKIKFSDANEVQLALDHHF